MSPDAVERLGPEHAAEVASVLAEAFADYPVMRFVIGERGQDYAACLDALVRFFVDARVERSESMIGVAGPDGLAAAALVSRPGGRDTPRLASLRADLWKLLGDGALERYRAFGAATAPFEVEAPHVHLNMIGVRSAHRGLGLGGALVRHVHAMSLADPTSEGVTLSTEDPANVALYEHLGYELVGHTELGPGLRTWGFYRPDPA